MGLLWIVGAVFFTVRAIAGHHPQVDSSGNLFLLYGNDPAAGWFNVVQWVFFPVLAACWLASLARQVLGYRRSSGERRQQLKWLMAGSALAFVGVALALLAGQTPLGAVFAVVGFLAHAAVHRRGHPALPLVRHRPDLSRTLAYAIVTGLLVGVYAGLVLLATQVFTIKSPVAVAAATLAAAALFNPVRHRVQRVVDRRFNRARYDADQRSPPSPPGFRTPSTSTRSAATWPGWSPAPWNRPTCRCGSAAVINDHKSGPDNLCWATISAGFRGAGCRRSQRTSAKLVAAVVESEAADTEHIHHGMRYGPRILVAIHL